MNHRYGLRVIGSVIALTLLMANPIQAQENDLLGIFFDPQGTVTTYQTSAPNEIVPIYLVLLAPSQSAGVVSWECIVEARSDAPAEVFDWQLAGGGANDDQPPLFHVNLGTPLPSADTVVLASASLLVAEPGTEVTFYLHAYDPPSLLDNGYPVQTPNYGYGGGNLQALGWTSGCESEPVALVNDDGEDIAGELGGIPAQLEFGVVSPGGSTTRIFWLTNPGAVTVSGVLDVSGEGYNLTHSSLPPIQSPCWFQLEPGQNLLVLVTLQPYDAGEHFGELTIEMCGEVSTVPLLGYSSSSCVISPPVLDFGEVQVSDTRTMTALVYNGGSQPLTIQPSEECADFSVMASSSTVPTGQSVIVYVQFTPAALGPQTCIVSLGTEACYDIVCTAIAAEAAPDCVVTNSGIAFGVLPIGMSSAQMFRIRNAGFGLLEGEVALAPDCTAFTIVNGSGPFSLAHDEVHIAAVRFTPDQVGELACLVDLGSQCDPVQLSGVGIIAVLSCSLDPESIDFGLVCAGTPVQREITIHNDGNWQFSGDLQVNGDGFSVDEPGTFFLNPGQSLTRHVTFNPPADGVYTGVITTGMTQCPSLPMTGTGWSEQACTLTPVAMDFGEQYHGWPTHQDLVISNEGCDVVNGTLAVADDGFSIENPGPFTLPPGQQFTCQVNFDPPGAGSYDGVVTTGLEDCPVVPLTGAGLPLPACDIEPSSLDFQIRVGESEEQQFTINNPSDGSLIVAIQVNSPHFAVVGDTSFTVGPGEQHEVTIAFTPQDYGWHQVLLDLGSQFCGPVHCTGYGTAGPVDELDRIGVFFDSPDYTVNTVNVTAGTTVEAYVVIKNPTYNGLYIWECCLPVEGENELLGVELMGVNAFNELTPPCYQVWSGWLFPDQAAVHVATLSVLVLCNTCTSHFLITPPPDPMVPGHPSYFNPNGWFVSLETITGEDLVANLNLEPVGVELTLPQVTQLHANAPNPFNPQTTLRFDLAHGGPVRLDVFDVSGRRVTVLVSEALAAGRHERVWTGRDSAGRSLPSGTYYARLEADGRMDMTKMLLLK